MPMPVNIGTLLEGNIIEHARIEFKETWDAAASLKTTCALANDLDNWDGGYIIIGVRENLDGSHDSIGGAAGESRRLPQGYA